MKALSIRQPWLYAILYEGKDVENRSRRTHHRGWIALHASGRPNFDARFPRGHRIPDLDALPYSAICGVARLVGVEEKIRSKWFQRPHDGSVNFGWVLDDATPLKQPIAAKGALGLWNLTASQIRSIQKQLPRLNLFD